MSARGHSADQTPHDMTVTVNGERKNLPAGCTVAGLIECLGLGQRACAVEVDRELIPRKDHAARHLAHGASVEIVTLVGGG